MSYAPPTLVPGQPLTALPYGLFSVLSPRPAGDGRWQSGIQWETLGCAPASGIGNLNCGPDGEGGDVIGLPKDFAGAGAVGEAEMFHVYGSYVCSPLGHTLEYAQEQATAHLLAREEARVEQALWTGDLWDDDSPSAGFAEGAVSVGDGLKVKQAIGALEDWLARAYGALGVLHMTRGMATLAVAEDAAVVKGSSLYSALGTPIVAGAGYPGTGPEGQDPAAGSGYIYATPALIGYRSEPFPGSEPAGAGLDRRTNDLYAATERAYVIGYDPCGTAVAGVSLT